MKDIYTHSKILDQKTIKKLYPLAHAGDKEAIRKICLSVWRLAASKAADIRKYKSQDISDYVSAGIMGVLSGIKNGKYDEKKGAFSTYITYYIAGFILKERDTSGVVRGSIHKRVFPKFELENKIEDKEDIHHEFDEVDKKDEQAVRLDKIHEKAQALTNIQRDVLYSYFLNGETLVSIGKRYELTKERIRQIRVEAIDLLKVRIGNVGQKTT